MVATRDSVDAPARDDEPPAAGPRQLARPWYDHVEYWVGIAVVAACCIYVFTQLQPSLLFRNTTTSGGDTGAHVWFPAYLRDHLLPWRLAGWAPDFYAGFPAGQFYFPLPALLIVALDVVIPYNIAFKLGTALGPIMLPVAAYSFGRGIRAPRPAPAFFAIGVTGFMFWTGSGDSNMLFDLHIMGGNLASTLAGEYSFMIAVGFALFFLGAFARALDGRRNLWLPAVLFAATMTSHLVVALFAVLGATILWLARRPHRTPLRAAIVLAVGGLLTAVWSLPLATTLGYTTDMRYDPVQVSNNYFHWLFPPGGGGFALFGMGALWYLYPLAIAAIVGGIVHRRRVTLEVAGLTAVAGFVFYQWEGIRHTLGKAPAWNLRFLPFWFVMLYLLAALGAAELARWVGAGVGWVVDQYRRDRAWVDWEERVGLRPEPSGAADATSEVGVPGDEPANTASPPESAVVTEPLPNPPRSVARSVQVVGISVLAVVAVVVALLRINDTRSFLPYWAKYNYSGYEDQNAGAATAKSYPEYKAFIDTVNALPPGRLLWEGGDAIGKYGTPLALMLLPYWTHGRIDSMEGLYFESSATTPYHFMTVATLAKTPSNPVRDLPYRSIADFDLGVRYMQLMGVHYYAAFSDDAKARAAANPNLHLVTTVPDLDGQPPLGWTIYRVADSPLVSPLAYRPVVVDGMHADGYWKCDGEPAPPAGTTRNDFNAWECTAVPWFNDPSALDRPLTDGGPSSWQHASPTKARRATLEPLPKVTVSHVKTTNDSVEFDVSRTGVPVMVKTSYFPNWRAEGANGPWRATPNFMVVVPTSHHVRLVYGTTTAEWVGRAGTLVGVGALAALVWWWWPVEDGRRRRPRLRFRSRHEG